jgi:ABC-2 type transport system ATP-binding protein
MAAIIEVKDLTKRYGSRTAVDNVSFSVEEGTIFGFIGPNGAGKTTTIRILATLLTLTSGQVRVGGYSIAKEPRAIRRILGYVPDFFGVYNDMKVWEYLDFFSACYHIPASQRPGLTRDLLELVDLSHRRDDFVEGLSRGMKQRLCLARALVHDPQILILDEPASGLDPRARVEFRDLLLELCRMGKTIFLSSHILADVAEICTGLGIIEAGQMVTHGNIEAIKQQLKQGHHLSIRVLGDKVEAAKAALYAIPGVSELGVEAAPEGDWDVTVEFTGDKAAVSDLLKQLILADIPVLTFTEESDSLEDMFMKLTKGIVS